MALMRAISTGLLGAYLAMTVGFFFIVNDAMNNPEKLTALAEKIQSIPGVAYLQQRMIEANIAAQIAQQSRAEKAKINPQPIAKNDLERLRHRTYGSGSDLNGVNN